MSKNGRVALVGAGPGDPGLLTLKGREYIEHADCIIYDRLASPELLTYAKRDCELIYVGKENHHHTMKQDDINALLFEKASSGAYSLIVRLKGGDPYVFGRGSEEAIYLSKRGIEVTVLPGISSCIAALETAGIPITHRAVAKGFQVITAHSRKDQAAEINYGQLLDREVTYVFLMGLAHVAEIAENMMAAGWSPNTPAAVISNGTTGRQRKCVGSLQDIALRVNEEKLESPAIIVVGEVVRLSEELSFFEQQPLFGKRYLVPFIRNEMEESKTSELVDMIRKRGGEALSLPIGKIEPIILGDEQLKSAIQSRWLMFTSKNGARAFLWNLKKAGMDVRILAGSKIAVIGAKTARVFEQVGIYPDFVAKTQTGEGLYQEFLEHYEEDQSGQQRISQSMTQGVTLFAAKKSNEAIVTELAARLPMTKIACYQNVELMGEEIKTLPTQDFDGVLFSSASSVYRTFRILDMGANPDLVYYSIGPMCSKALRDQGVDKYLEAEPCSYEGMIAIVK